MSQSRIDRVGIRVAVYNRVAIESLSDGIAVGRIAVESSRCQVRLRYPNRAERVASESISSRIAVRSVCRSVASGRITSESESLSSPIAVNESRQNESRQNRNRCQSPTLSNESCRQNRCRIGSRESASLSERVAVRIGIRQVGIAVGIRIAVRVRVASEPVRPNESLSDPARRIRVARMIVGSESLSEVTVGVASLSESESLSERIASSQVAV